MLKKYPDASLERIASVLNTLRDEKLQSDERFVESYVRYRKSRGFGVLHIQADLSARRVSDTLLETYLGVEDGDDETLQALIHKKLTKGQPLRFGDKAHRKIVNFLQSRGFTHEQVRRALEPWIEST